MGVYFVRKEVYTDSRNVRLGPFSELLIYMNGMYFWTHVGTKVYAHLPPEAIVKILLDMTKATKWIKMEYKTTQWIQEPTENE